MRSFKSPSTSNLIFTAVLSLTLTSGGTAVHLASQPIMSEHQNRVLDSAMAICTTGSMALIGLVSGRSQEGK